MNSYVAGECDADIPSSMAMLYGMNEEIGELGDE